MASALGFNYPHSVCLIPFVGYCLIESRMKFLTCQLTDLIAERLLPIGRLYKETVPCHVNPFDYNKQERKEILKLLKEMIDRLEYKQEALKTTGAAFVAFSLAHSLFSSSLSARFTRIPNFFIGISLMRLSSYEPTRLQSTRQALHDFQKGRTTEIEIYN
ncbi:MAG TPA: hypothetical protein VLG44_08545 [Chlamydiales bacterium]|nr:hypothetical protein [Chlamydiales bacterium]